MVIRTVLLLLPLTALALIFLYFKIPGLSLIEQKELKLSDFPEVFKENTVIVVGDNASEVEKQAAEQIADYLKQITKNKPEIISSKNFKKFKHDYNLIILGTPKSNPVLKEVYEMTNTIRVNESYPGENKGILEILRNPWNKEKALLLVEGSDEWGVKAGSESVVKDKNKLTKWFLTTIVAEFKPLTEKEMRKIAKEKLFKFKQRFPFGVYESPEDFLLEELKVPLVKNHKIYKVFPRVTNVPDISITTVAIGYDGEFFVLPEEFNKMIKRESLLLDSKEKVLQLCKLYLLIEENSKYDVLILRNATDIPCVKNATKYKEISPPFIQEKDRAYYVELYSWKELGGELIRWVFLIEKNGEIKNVEKYIIARSVGCALYIA